MNLMQLPHEQGKNQDIEVDVVLPLFVSGFGSQAEDTRFEGNEIENGRGNRL